MKRLFSLASAVVMLMSGVLTASAIEHTTPVKVQGCDYLYEMTCKKLNYAEGEKFLDTYNILAKAGCSGVRVGNFHGRNLDWYKDDAKEYVVHIPAEEGRHASVGVAAIITSGSVYTESARTLPQDTILKYLPYAAFDGINDAGVVIQCNMTNTDYGATTGSNPDGEDLNSTMVPRFVLDNAGSVEEALKLLKERNVIMPKCFDMHWMISDPKRTVVVEYIKNEMRVDSTANIITNFYVTLPYYQRTGMGIERFNILKTFYPEGKTKEGMIKLLGRVRYTKQKDLSVFDTWVSEWNGTVVNGDTLTVYSTRDEERAKKQQEYNKEKEHWERNKGAWHTIHNATYDIANRTVTIIAQEDTTKQYDFGLVQKEENAETSVK